MDWKPQSVLLTEWEGTFFWRVRASAAARVHGLGHWCVRVGYAACDKRKIGNLSVRLRCITDIIDMFSPVPQFSLLSEKVCPNSLKIPANKRAYGSAEEPMTAEERFWTRHSESIIMANGRVVYCVAQPLIRLRQSSSTADVRPIPFVLKNNSRKKQCRIAIDDIVWRARVGYRYRRRTNDLFEKINIH